MSVGRRWRLVETLYYLSWGAIWPASTNTGEDISWSWITGELFLDVARENCQLSESEIKLLVELFHLPEQKILDVFKRFQSATKGEKSLNRRKFSDIMHQCFPRTHKVKTQKDLVFFYHNNAKVLCWLKPYFNKNKKEWNNIISGIVIINSTIKIIKKKSS